MCHRNFWTIQTHACLMLCLLMGDVCLRQHIMYSREFGKFVTWRKTSSSIRSYIKHEMSSECSAWFECIKCAQWVSKHALTWDFDEQVFASIFKLDSFSWFSDSLGNLQHDFHDSVNFHRHTDLETYQLLVKHYAYCLLARVYIIYASLPCG